VTEAGNAVAGSDNVWTHTDTDGTTRSNANHCGNWGAATGDGGVGKHTPPSNDRWTETGTRPCNTGAHLYCFQQS
jgi:hypothetical protein